MDTLTRKTRRDGLRGTIVRCNVAALEEIPSRTKDQGYLVSIRTHFSLRGNARAKRVTKGARDDSELCALPENVSDR